MKYTTISSILIITIAIAILTYITNNDHQVYAIPYIHLSASLSKDEIQPFSNQMWFHFNAPTDIIELDSDVSGQNVTTFPSFADDQKTITVATSTMSINFNLFLSS